MLKRTLLEITAMTGLGVDYASAYVIAFVWSWPDPWQILVHILMVFIASLLFGAFIVDMKKTLFYTIGSILIGIFLATTIISVPFMTTAGGTEFLDVSITTALVPISRLFLIGVTLMIIGIIIGCFVGDMMSGLSET